MRVKERDATFLSHPPHLRRPQRPRCASVQQATAGYHVGAQARVAALPKRCLSSHVSKQLAQAVTEALNACAARKRHQQGACVRSTADSLQQRASEHRGGPRTSDQLIPQPSVRLALHKLQRLPTTV